MLIRLNINEALPVNNSIIEIETIDGNKQPAYFEITIVNNSIVKRFHDLQGSCIEATHHMFKYVEFW